MRDQLPLLALAVVFMLGGAVPMLAGVVPTGIAIPLVSVGIALVVVSLADGRRRHAGLR